MADTAITNTTVAPTAAQIAAAKSGTAGATITAGDWLYLDSTTGTLKLANNTTSAVTAVVEGIAINDAVSGQPIDYMQAGDLVVGATSPVLVQGNRYFLSSTDGVMFLDSDLATPDVVVYLCTAVNTTTLRINIVNTTIAI